MSLMQQINEDMKTAMKAKERMRLDTLRLLRAGIQQKAIELKVKELDDAEVIQILNKQAKQRRETMEMARENNRQDMLDQSTQELAIINTYLPKPFTDEELEAIVREAIKESGDNRGAVIKSVLEKASGRADGGRVNQMVQKIASEGKYGRN